MARRVRRKRSNKKIYFKVGTLVLALTALFILAFFLYERSTRKDIDLNNSTYYSIKGFNGNGELEAAIDVESGYEAFFDTVKVESDKNSNLANGDEIVLSYTYDASIAKAYHLRVFAEDKHIIVSDLIDPTVLSVDDIFEGVSLIYEGISPLVTATLNVENKWNGLVTYEVVDAKEYYNVGDPIVVRALYEEAVLADYNYVTEMSSDVCVKEFTVTDVDRYADKVEDITEDMLASLKKEAFSLFTDANEYGMRIFCDAGLMPVYINGKTTFSWNSPSYISSYLRVLKPENRGKVGASANEVMLCFETMISQADGKACRAEVIIMFTDIIIRRDGTVDLNLSSGDLISADRRDSHIKAIVSDDIDDEYESFKLN